MARASRWSQLSIAIQATGGRRSGARRYELMRRWHDPVGGSRVTYTLCVSSMDHFEAGLTRLSTCASWMCARTAAARSAGVARRRPCSASWWRRRRAGRALRRHAGRAPQTQRTYPARVRALLGWRFLPITGSPTAMPIVCDGIHLALTCEEAVQRNLERDLVRTLFEPCARDLVARAHLTQQTRVLDHACGTGVVARMVRAAVPEIGPIVGIDPMTEALEVAAEAAPQEKWIRGEAEALPFGDDRFDVLLCQHSLQHFYSRATALAQVKRVLAPGGRAWFSVWSQLEDNPGYVAIREALAGIDETRAMAEGIAPGFWDAGPAQLVHELESAGLEDVSCNTIKLPAVFASADELPSQWLACSIRICRRRRSGELPSDVLQEFVARASEALGRYRTAGGEVEVPMTVHVVTGTA